MEYATRGGLVIWDSKPLGGRVYGFGPQNPGGGSEEERTARSDIETKLSHEGCSDRRIKITSGWTIAPSG
jgi:hypothetical protein